MNKKLIQILKVDEVEFENANYEKYIRWCMNVSVKGFAPLQTVIANGPISKYYNHELKKLQNNFLNLIEGKTKYLEQKAINDLYEIIVVDIFKHYPSALVEAAKNIKIENQISLN